MLASQESGGLLALELALWTIPAALGISLVLRSRSGTRIGWLIVGGACTLIVLDKAFDLLGLAHRTGQDVIRIVDPVKRLRGDHLAYRFLLLGGLFGAGSMGLVVSIRRDQDRSGAKLIALTGLLCILAYLAARLVPGIRHRLDPPLGWVIEAACWGMILVGLLRGRGDLGRESG